jgi:hypothetical protein
MSLFSMGLRHSHARGEERRKLKRFKQCPSPLPFPAEWRGKKEWKDFNGKRRDFFRVEFLSC